MPRAWLLTSALLVGVAVGQIAGIASVVSFIGAGLVALFALLGLLHARRTSPVVDLGATKPVRKEMVSH